MTSEKPLGPFSLTPARITLLILGALALIMIVGALLGGVANYAELGQAATSSSAQPAAPSSEN